MMPTKIGRRRLLKSTLFAGSLACLPIPTQKSAQASLLRQTYYVDYEQGNDQSDGLNAQRPRKTIPINIGPGCMVIFKGGSRYKTSLAIESGGTQDDPVVYDGNTENTFGNGPALIDGWLELQNWQKAEDATWTTHLPTDATGTEFDFKLVMYQDADYCAMSTLPIPSDPMIELTEETYQALSIHDDGTNSTVYAPDIFVSSDGYDGSFIKAHVAGNVFKLFPIISSDHNKGTVVVTGLIKTIENRFMLLNHRDGLRPGTYTIDTDSNTLRLQPHGLTPPSKARVRIAGRQNGITVDADHVTIRGFDIEGLQNVFGVHVKKGRENCIVKNMKIKKSAFSKAAIWLDFCNRSASTKNEIEDVIHGRGILVHGADHVIKSNRVMRTWMTCIAVFSGNNCRVVGNVVGRPLSIHANGISCYLGSKRCIFLFNSVIFPEAKNFAFTAQKAEGLVIAFNSFVSNWRAVAHHPDKADSGGHVWSNNIALSAEGNTAFFIHLDGGSNTTISNNICDGMAIPASPPLLSNVKNAHTRVYSGNSVIDTFSVKSGNTDVHLVREKLFVDLEGAKNLRPSRLGGKLLGVGQPTVIEGVKIDWIGRYRPDGSEAWDWEG